MGRERGVCVWGGGGGGGIAVSAHTVDVAKMSEHKGFLSLQMKSDHTPTMSAKDPSRTSIKGGQCKLDAMETKANNERHFKL